MPYMVIGGDINKEIGDINRADLVKYCIPPDDYRLVMSAYPGNRQISLKKELLHLKKQRKKSKIIQLFQLAVSTVASGQQPGLSDNQEIDIRMFFPALPENFCKYQTMKNIISHTELLIDINQQAAELRKSTISNFEFWQKINELWVNSTGTPEHAVVKTAYPRLRVANSSVELIGSQVANHLSPPLVEVTSVKKSIEPTARLDPTDTKNRIKHEVKFCGENIWPSDYLKNVTFNDMNAGFHLVQFWVKHLENATPQKPKEVALKIRSLIHDIKAASSLEGLADVMIACITAYSKVNDQQDVADMSDCIPPGLAR